MKKKFFYFLPFFVFMLIAFFLWRGLRLDPAQLPSTLIDKVAPSFVLPSLLDEQKKIRSSIFYGKISIVHVWSSECKVCENEYDVLLQLAQLPKVQLIGLDYEDDPISAKRYLLEKGNPYHQVLRGDQKNVGLNWGIYGTPETFVIDQRGVIRGKWLGSLNEEKTREQLKACLRSLKDA
ncbi:MAG: redoxin domain-containing protein [Gammaproteobacteria bacterium]|nr:redoxin domain-containing protein [Gammaproteobacteria bacterium]